MREMRECVYRDACIDERIDCFCKAQAPRLHTHENIHIIIVFSAMCVLDVHSTPFSGGTGDAAYASNNDMRLAVALTAGDDDNFAILFSLFCFSFEKQIFLTRAATAASQEGFSNQKA